MNKNRIGLWLVLAVMVILVSLSAMLVVDAMVLQPPAEPSVNMSGEIVLD